MRLRDCQGNNQLFDRIFGARATQSLLLGKPLQKLEDPRKGLSAHCLECLQADAAAKGKHTPGNRGTPKAFP